jgi:sugar lactone lactonase YvrE
LTGVLTQIVAQQTIEIEISPRLLAEGFRFTECPRWRPDEGRLYFSDMHCRKVHRMDEAGTVETVCTLPSNAGGIGFLPDGDMLVAAMGRAGSCACTQAN